MAYNTSMHTSSLYIHWPFCPYKCHFCPFVAFAGQDHLMERYHKALTKEIASYAHSSEYKEPIKTIFFGGGTPSTYPDHLMLDMFAILRKSFVIDQDAEISIEVNPGTVRPEQIELWQQLGINRLSIGVQSLNDAVLKNLNRHQSAADVIAVLNYAQDRIAAISIDLIIGLPGIETDEWKELLHQVVQWPVHHVSVYFLTVHEGTALSFRVKKNDVVIPPDESVVDLYMWTVDFLAEHGFEQYEISNFARNGCYARHNQVYWARAPYKGFGVGACSFDGTHRYQNTKNLVHYLEGIEQENDVNDFIEELTSDQVVLEEIMLGLRQATGIKEHRIFEHCTPEQEEKVRQVVKEGEQAGYIQRRDDTIRLTPLGLAVENELVVKLSQ